MSVQDLIEILERVEDKNMEVVVPDMEFGFRSACFQDTGIAEDNLNIKTFVIMPCFCADDYEEVEDDDDDENFELTNNGVDPRLN